MTARFSIDRPLFSLDNMFFSAHEEKIIPQHKLEFLFIYFFPQTSAFTHHSYSWLISCHTACAMFFHSSIVQIGYCLWCMILKADRLRRDQRHSRRLTEQANKQIQVIFVDARRHVAPRAQQRDIHSIFMPPLKCQKYWWPWAEISLLVKIE